jgi:hypothetical protein
MTGYRHFYVLTNGTDFASWDTEETDPIFSVVLTIIDAEKANNNTQDATRLVPFAVARQRAVALGPASTASTASAASADEGGPRFHLSAPRHLIYFRGAGAGGDIYGPGGRVPPHSDPAHALGIAHG